MEDDGWPVATGVWANTALRLPNDAPVVWRSVFTGEDVVVAPDGTVLLGAVLGELPVALLSSEVANG